MKVVNTIVTELAEIQVTPRAWCWKSRAGAEPEEVQKRPEPKLIVSAQLKVMDS